MDPVLKALLNSMKCPVCGGQIDGVTKFHCAFSKQHYSVVIDNDNFPIRITHEYVRVNDGHKQYYIIQSENRTEINILQLNGDYEVIPPDKTQPAPKPFVYDKRLFVFSKTNREKLINKVKTILVFS